MPRYQSDRPIILGIAGEAGTGKTVTANALAPQVRMEILGSTGGAVWEHLVVATPLYEMVTILRKTEGEKEFDRRAYAVHDVLVDLFGYPLYGAPAYQDLVNLVTEVVCFQMPPEDQKPREFMQWAGDSVRKLMPDCFPQWLTRKVATLYSYFRSEYEDDVPAYGVVISDVRLGNEVDFILGQPNGVLVKLVAGEEVRRRRLTERDGIEMSVAQRSHVTETWLAQADDRIFDAIIDTSGLTLSEQMDKVLRAVYTKLDVGMSV